MATVQTLLIQKQQLQNLSNIYLSDLEIQRQTHPARFSILIHPFSDKAEDDYKVRIHVEFSTEYPKKPLNLEVEALIGITSENVAAIERTARGVMTDSLGRPFVYDIVETSRKWIQSYLVEGIEQEEEEEIGKRTAQVFERPKYATYTPVTLENFMAWKKVFEEQMFEAKRKRQAELEERMSGKQYFKTNEVNESDEEDEDAEVVQEYTKKQEEKVLQEDEEEYGDQDEDDEMWSPN